MRCPVCGSLEVSEKSEVMDVEYRGKFRYFPEYIYYKCLDCGDVFYTEDDTAKFMSGILDD